MKKCDKESTMSSLNGPPSPRVPPRPAASCTPPADSWPGGPPALAPADPAGPLPPTGPVVLMVRSPDPPTSCTCPRARHCSIPRPCRWAAAAPGPPPAAVPSATASSLPSSWPWLPLLRPLPWDSPSSRLLSSCTTSWPGGHAPRGPGRPKGPSWQPARGWVARLLKGKPPTYCSLPMPGWFMAGRGGRHKGCSAAAAAACCFRLRSCWHSKHQ
ncbi:hypothetical protein V8C86DRAFT_2736936 [Haematococcus lacustris]